MSPTLGLSIRRLARIRCPMWSVGSIEPLGIRYGLTMNAWISRARPTAIATVITSSISDLTVDLGAFAEDARAIRLPIHGRARRPTPPARRSSLLRSFDRGLVLRGLRFGLGLGGGLRLNGGLRLGGGLGLGRRLDFGSRLTFALGLRFVLLFL